MKKLCSIVIAFFALSSYAFGGGGGYFESKGANILRVESLEGYLEYEFFKNGDLNSYEYTANSASSGPEISDEIFLPKFQVFSLKWEMDGEYLVIYRGPKISRTKITTDGKYFYFLNSAWERVDSLRFLKDLEEFSKRR